MYSRQREAAFKSANEARESKKVKRNVSKVTVPTENQGVNFKHVDSLDTFLNLKNELLSPKKLLTTMMAEVYFHVHFCLIPAANRKEKRKVDAIQRFLHKMKEDEVLLDAYPNISNSDATSVSKEHLASWLIVFFVRRYQLFKTSDLKKSKCFEVKRHIVMPVKTNIKNLITGFKRREKRLFPKPRKIDSLTR